jgi:serpin peptidase inhibitor clade A protein 3
VFTGHRFLWLFNFSFILRKIKELHLPKFSLSQHYNLEDILPELGIRELFSTQADLSGITGVKNITVSEVRQGTRLIHFES